MVLRDKRVWQTLNACELEEEEAVTYSLVVREVFKGKVDSDPLKDV